MQDVIGWASSFVLVLTILAQVFKQWRDHTSAGVSIWFYIGQVVAEAGFVVYSWQVRDWVFVVTNALLLLTSLFGLGLVLHHRRRARLVAYGKTRLSA